MGKNEKHLAPQIINEDNSFGINSKIVVNKDPLLKVSHEKLGVLYGNMLLDPRVKSSIDERIHAVQAMEIELTPKIENLRARTAIRLLESAIDKIGWHDFVEAILQCVVYGFSISEPLWNAKTYMPEHIASRDVSRFVFSTDGKLKWYKKNSIEPVDVNESRLIISRNGRGMYGQSALQSAYWIWRAKKELLKQLIRYGEQHAQMKSFLLTDPEKQISPDDLAALAISINDAGQDGAAALPNWVSDWRRLTDNGSGAQDFYNKILEYYDDQIAIAISGQTAGSQEAKGGLGGQQVGQVLTKKEVALSDAKKVEKAIKHLYEMFIPWHLGYDYPEIEIDVRPVADEALDQKLEQVKVLVEAGLELSSTQVRQLFGFDEPNNETDVLKRPEMPSLGLSLEKKTFANSIDEPKKDGLLQFNYRLAKARDDKLIQLSDVAAEKALKIYERVVNDYIDNIDSIEGARGYDWSVYSDTLSKLHTNIAIAGIYLGAGTIIDRIDYDRVSNFSLEAIFDIAEGQFLESGEWATMLPERLIDEISSIRAGQTILESDDVLELCKRYGAEVAAEEVDYMSTRAGQEITRALIEQPTLAEFKAGMSETLANAGVGSGKSYHVQTIYRTALKEAYSVGNYNELMNNDIAREFFPYVQYVAIIDGRTREDHEAMNGVIFAVGSGDHYRWTPPNGYNCRCDLVEINRFEAEREGIIVTQFDAKLSPDRDFDGLGALGRALIQ